MVKREENRVLNKRKEKLKWQSGITLIALIVTIIIMLILAAVSINLAVGNDGLIGQAQNAKEMSEEVAHEEKQDELYVKDKILDRDKYYYVEKEDNEKEHITVDMTNQEEQGDATEHPHVFVSKWSSTQHWQECFICASKINVANHHIVKTYQYPDQAHCGYWNAYISYCSDNCGYSVSGTDSHPWAIHGYGVYSTTTELGSIYCVSGQYSHHRSCSVCGTRGPGERCKLANGTIIHCGNLGRCVVCNNNYTSAVHKPITTDNKNAKCAYCNIPLFNYELVSKAYNASDKSKTYIIRVKPASGKTLTSVTGSAWSPTGGLSVTYGTVTGNDSSGYLVPYIVKSTTEPYQRRRTVQLRPNFRVNGSPVWTEFSMIDATLEDTDTTAPTITSVTENKSNIYNGWCSSDELTVKGAEAYSELAYITLKQGNTVVFSEASVPTVNGNYTFTFTPKIEAGGSTAFTVQVRDIYGNKSTKNVTLSKIDSKAPTIVANGASLIEDGKVLNYTGNSKYERYRQITIVAKDEGSGEVQFAFNDPSKFNGNMKKEGNLYYYTYRCGGNVYGNDMRGVAIYLKDGAGNVSTYGLRVDKIDSTEPTITAVNKTAEGVYTVTANDIDTKLGQSGSGVVEYAYSKYPDWWTNLDYQTSPDLNISKRGHYYVFAKDGAGNFSKGFEIDVE